MPTTADNQTDDTLNDQGISDMYGDSDEETPEEPATFGDQVSNTANNLSQDFRDADTVSGGKLGEGVRDKANDIKDRYFPGKKQDQDGQNEQGNPSTPESAESKDHPNQPKPGEPSKPEAPGQGNNPYNEAPLSRGASPAQAPDANFSMDSLGQKSAQAAEQTANLTDKAIKGTEALNEGAAIAAESGALTAEATTGAATGGAAVAVIEGAKAAYKAAKTAYNMIKKGLEIKERVQAFEDLVKRRWYCCACLILPLIVIGGLSYYVYSNILHLDTISKIGKSIVSIFHRNRSTENIVFTDANSADLIESGEIGKNAAYALSSIADKKATVVYKDISPVTGRPNEPYEFDILSYDTIKCTFAGEKIPEIKIDFSKNYNWQNQIIAGKESAICSSDYYPEIDSSSPDYSALSPGEFTLGEIAAKAPHAVEQKALESIERILKANSQAVKDDQQVPLHQLTLDISLYSSISSQLLEIIARYYPDRPANEIIATKDSSPGVHFDFGLGR